jgi:thymidylate synthase
MTQYSGRRGDENQLDNIIAAIKTRKTRCRAAYTIVIQYPGTETTQKMGGPCLNYLTVQIDPSPPTRLGMLAVYRNHDFLERAYGNYWGLCNLVKFLAHETGMNAGPLTCVSSHAFVAEKRAKFKRFLDTR